MNDILSMFYRFLKEPSSSPRAVAFSITEDGNKLREVLDEKPYNHALAFNYMASCLELPYMDTILPIVAGRNLSSQDVLAGQIRDGICLCFFPSHISDIQYSLLEEELSFYDNLVYQFDGNPEEETFLSREELLTYAKNYSQNKVKLVMK